jgi:hypothetical protein
MMVVVVDNSMVDNVGGRNNDNDSIVREGTTFDCCPLVEYHFFVWRVVMLLVLLLLERMIAPS